MFIDEEESSAGRLANLDIAKSRTGTNVSKCILNYEEQPSLYSLISVLEEISKNSSFAADLRLSLTYYTDEVHRQFRCFADKRRGMVAAASAIEYIGKIYGDRVECIYQNVEHQLQSLLSSTSPTDEANGEETTAKPEEPKKRRVKKLTQQEVDPYMVTLEPRKFKTLSSEKRFSTNGFVKCMRNRTIEYLYQDHTLPNIWKQAPIVDLVNPNELDEKKNYKLFTYHVEHRYNTLICDIPFERLNLMKDYVSALQVNEEGILNESMTTKDYLHEYIALENQMLADRYGATSRSSLKRKEVPAVESMAKRQCQDATEDFDMRESVSPLPEQQGSTEPMQTQISVDSALGDTLNENTLEGPELNSISFNGTFDQNQVLSSTLDFNNSKILESTKVDEGNLTSNAENAQLQDNIQTEQSIVEESGIVSDKSNSDDTNVAYSLQTAQSDATEACEHSQKEQQNNETLQVVDSGICLDDVTSVPITDIEDLRLLQPNVFVQDILPGIPNKSNLTVHIDEEMLGLAGVATEKALRPAEVEEIVNASHKECFEITINIMGIPRKVLRRECLFKLPKDFDLFKEMRLPSRPEAEQKQRNPRGITDFPAQKQEPISIYPRYPAVIDKKKENDEFNFEEYFLGFNDLWITKIANNKTRRSTHDSGIDHDQQPLDSAGAIEATLVTIKEENVSTEIAPTNETSVVASNEDVVIEVEEDEVSPQIATNNLPAALANDDDVVSTQIAANNLPVLANEEDVVMNVQLEVEEVLDIDIVDADSNRENTRYQATNELLNEASYKTLNEIPAVCDTEDTYELLEETTLGDDTSKRIQDWHRRMGPILEAAHERQNFNISDLGTEILNVCSSRNGQASLADVMDGKDPSTKSRFFLASLLLTNHGNISLVVDKSSNDKPIHVSDLRMNLLTIKRQQIHPEDDVGNTKTLKPVTEPKAIQTKSSLKRKLVDEPPIQVDLKTVRLIEPVPKQSERPEEADSGISSLQESTSSYL